MGLAGIAHIVGYLIQFIGFAIFARSLLSWFPIDRNGPVVQALVAITDPVLDPLRRVIPPIGMIDISPMIAMIVLFIIARQLITF
ncbi:MAG: YggT family protein [Dehalococcoidia bacterium]|nr:YggT family protein [Dehalococcoidia bacterium]